MFPNPPYPVEQNEAHRRIVKGDLVSILVGPSRVIGTVTSAALYKNGAIYYIELTERRTGLPHYWKQSHDGGYVILLDD